MGNVVTLTPATTPPQPEEGKTVQAIAESVTEMSRSDRRIIFAKLEECYHDEEHGYRAPWTDQAVAKDLGSHIPVGWVAQVREENFGPVKDNAEIRDMLVRVSIAATDARALLEEARAHRAMADTVVKSNNQLMERCTEIGKTLAGLLATADRIAKALK